MKLIGQITLRFSGYNFPYWFKAALRAARTGRVQAAAPVSAPLRPGRDRPAPQTPV